MLVGRIFTCGVDNCVIRTEPRKGVNMRIGIITCQVAALDPQNPFCAQSLTNKGLDAAARQVRITIRAEQAGGCREDGPTPVAVDASAFQDEPDCIQRCFAEGSANGELSGYLIVQVGRELESPAVKAKIEDYRSIALNQGKRPKIPRPGVIGLDAAKPDRSRARPALTMDCLASSISGATITRRSKRVISAAISIVTRCTASRLIHSVAAWGQAMSTPSCSSHSAGNLRIVSSTWVSWLEVMGYGLWS